MLSGRRALELLVDAVLIVWLWTLPGCTEFDVFIQAASDEGTVYDCTTSPESTFKGRTVELCYHDDSEDELGEMLGGACERGDRRWVKFTNLLTMGCNYSCPHYGPGCNAHQGCYCPTEP